MWKLIVQVKQATATNYRPCFCDNYSRSWDEYDESHPIIESHDNSKFQREIDRLHIITAKTILHRPAEMAFSGISATSIYGTQSTQLDPYTLEIQSSKPPNLKQVKNSLSSVPNGEKQNNDGLMSIFT